MKKLCIIIYLLSITACNSANKNIYPDELSMRTVPLFVISHGWHTGIAIQQEYISDWISVRDQVPRGNYLMFEWGDADYFPSEDPGFGLLLKAALLPTPSVIQITGMNVTPDLYFQNSTVIQVNITPEGMSALTGFLYEQFHIHTDGQPSFVQAGLYPNSAFFEASQAYMLPRTSNSWTASALHKTGYPINPLFTFTSGSLIRKAKRDGIVLQQH